MEKIPVNQKDRIILILIILAGSALIFFFMPWINLHPDACIHRKITGIGCPLCGMTHAVYELLHFRFWRAIQNNQAIPFMVIWFGMECLTLIKPTKLNSRMRKISLILFLASLVAVYALRIAHLIWMLKTWWTVNSVNSEWGMVNGVKGNEKLKDKSWLKLAVRI